MKMRMLIAAAAFLASASCNMVSGIGKDLSTVGEAVNRAATDAMGESAEDRTETANR
jgi:predicted small secreted protein